MESAVIEAARAIDAEAGAATGIENVEGTTTRLTPGAQIVTTMTKGARDRETGGEDLARDRGAGTGGRAIDMKRSVDATEAIPPIATGIGIEGQDDMTSMIAVDEANVGGISLIELIYMIPSYAGNLYSTAQLHPLRCA